MAHAFCDSLYLAVVNTNNGIETQNNFLNYNFCPHNKQRANATVSAIAVLLGEDYLSTANQKYQLQKYKKHLQTLLLIT